MTVPAARVLAFPGIDLEALTKLRSRACDAFMSDDLTAYQDACMMMRKLLGGRDVSEADDRAYSYREESPPQRVVPQDMRDRLSAKGVVL
jgi:ABC-type amino acid transport substrate-binding protein